MDKYQSLCRIIGPATISGLDWTGKDRQQHTHTHTHTHTHWTGLEKVNKNNFVALSLKLVRARVYMEQPPTVVGAVFSPGFLKE